MRRFECALGEASQDEGVHKVRTMCAVACLAALFSVSQTSISHAASANQRANVSYSSASSNSSPMSSRAEAPVPDNCIRQECGKLWCWQMKGSGH